MSLEMTQVLSRSGVFSYPGASARVSTSTMEVVSIVGPDTLAEDGAHRGYDTSVYQWLIV